MVSDFPNYNRSCTECRTGHECTQPYEALDGTVYYCTRIEGAINE